MNGTIRQVCRNVKRWRDAEDGAALDRRRHAGGRQGLSAAQGQAKQLPILRAALAAHQAKNATNTTLEQQTRAA